MRRVALILFLLGASSAYAQTFTGYITSFETVTAPNTYSNALSTLSSRSLIGYAGWYAAPPVSDDCYFGVDSVGCINACFGNNYIGIQWSGGAMAPETDFGGDDCPLGAADFSWGGGIVTGYVENLNVGSPVNSSYQPIGTELYEGVSINFQAPDIPASAPWLVSPSLWSGTGTFFYMEYSQPGGTTIAGYQGTFDVGTVLIPEPATLGLMLAGIALLGVARSRQAVLCS